MIKRRPTTQYTIGNKRLNHNNLHGERYYDWFEKTFGLNPLQDNTKLLRDDEGRLAFDAPAENPCTHHIQHSEQAGAVFITRPPKMPATASTKTMLGEGSEAFPLLPPIHNTIDSEADLKTFLKMSTPHSLRFGDYSSPIPIIKSCEVLD